MAASTASARDGSQANRARIASQSPAGAELAPAALCLLVALTPLVFAARLFEPYITPKEVLLQAGTATVALLWIFTARKESWTLTLTPVWLPVIALIALGSLSILWSTNRSASITEAWRLSACILLFVTALQAMRSTEARVMLATALIFAGTIEAIYVLLQYGFGDPVFLTARLPGKWRTFGTLGNPNWTGEFLAVTALVSLGRLVDLRKEPSRSWSQQGTLAAGILMLLALGATLARGSWVAFVIGAAAFLIARRHLSNARRVLRSAVLPLAITIVAGLVLILLPLLADRDAINHLLNLKSARGRIWMWLVTGTMIRDAPLGGHGLGTFGSQFPLYQARTFTLEWAVRFIPNASFTSYAHNDYLQLWTELGFFALVAFAALIWILLKRGRQLAANPIALGCWAAVISLLVNAAVAFPLHLAASLMLFVVLIAVVEATVSKRTVGLKRRALPARIGIVVLVSMTCFAAYRSSYHRLAADAALWRADAALEAQRWSEAEISIRAEIYHAPDHLAGQAMLGRLHLERGENQEALVALDRAMKLGFSEEVYDWKATALERTGQRAAAMAVLNELVWLRPDLTWPKDRLASLGR